ncbi:MAG: polysaccharide biosynthesis C-terminal domain-containing protein [Deltaproteobacteria bacterium]|nr:polysaccharide biosynthesis C-terminal domain-containing protein [Deltaproteobacteria bacterium]
MQTIFMTAILFTNVAFNAVCIPLWGVEGAAAATAGSFIATVFYLKWLVKKAIGLQI